MSKERLEEYRKAIDFLDDSADMQDHGRFVDTCMNLYEDGWFHWINKYAKEQTRRVEELEMKYENIGAIFSRQSMRDRIQVLERQNKHYREALKNTQVAIQKNLEKWNYKDEEILYEAYKQNERALEGDPHD